MKVDPIETKNYSQYNIPVNQILNEDCVLGLREFPNDCIDLVVTSPPYDNIRDYHGFAIDLSQLGKELFRVLKPGGVVALVMQDQTKNFAKSLTSFRTIIDWCDNGGFKLFECVIYKKFGMDAAWWRQRFRMDHEYMPIFFKGERPQYFNKEPLKIPSKHGNKTMTGGANRKTNGSTMKSETFVINPMKCRGTIWEYLNAGDKDVTKRKHPAPFPDKIPYDFINCFCPPDGIVLDPMMGSGSTAVSALKLNRNFVGFEISKEYCKIANERIAQTQSLAFPA
ncbi:MAG: site-specific DNA-methyltransferase [Bacteroidetes bacterium]|nr:site-specific DNA-methyltransferase [Bacteroidota bacterium]